MFCKECGRPALTGVVLCSSCYKKMKSSGPEYQRGFKDGFRSALDWHSVKKDGLPPEDGTYLVTTVNKAVFFTHFYSKTGNFSSSRMNALVTHWAPKPAPAED